MDIVADKDTELDADNFNENVTQKNFFIVFVSLEIF
jgi:hypothetical protein